MFANAESKSLKVDLVLHSKELLFNRDMWLFEGVVLIIKIIWIL